MGNETHLLGTLKKVVSPILYLGQKWNSYDDYRGKGNIFCQNFLNVIIGELWLMKEMLSINAKLDMIVQKESSKMI
jgi:hypothetical protein